MIEQKVNLGDRTYSILIGDDAFALALNHLSVHSAGGEKVACVADEAVLQLHPSVTDWLRRAGVELIPVHGGESSKSFAMLEMLCEKFAEIGLDRKSRVVALGGGVIGDLTGFAAASYMRSIDFVQIPTTLLAMVDSSVGGKTGINIRAGKNLVGAFHQPSSVYIDMRFLATLPKREFSAGLAEVVKCGALGDPDLFANLESQNGDFNFASQYLPEAVRRSCALKAKIVAQDERETSKEGGRALLNFGHTLAHAVEKCAGYGVYVHGEAVAIGMVFAAKLSQQLGTLDAKEAVRVENLLAKFNLPTQIPSNLNVDEMISAMRHDKKSVGGNLRFVLLDGIGKSYTKTLDEAVVRSIFSR